jgi:AbrB family looped-hinge helix DNA binding protein
MVLQTEVKVLPKGQVVIPAKVRKSLNIKPGDKLKLIQKGNEIILLKIEDPVKSLIKMGKKIRITREEVKESRRIE